jgi:(1->4)-alpha-D-glucan 1-alpha-D-glucosylmutase
MPTPRSTYRVQVSPDFDLDATANLAGYLARLGASHLYVSPILQSAPGSAHGYDVVDHNRVDDARGGEPARLRLMAALRGQRLGMVVDIVPNHMGISPPETNGAWWDVLRLGPQSAYATYFDIDWSRGRLLIPVLADDSSALRDLQVVDGELRYFEHRFPLAARTVETGTPQEIHDRQHYELVSWRRGDAEVNYRRFFAVSTLAGLRVEDPMVFDATHAEILRWASTGDADGIRIDHPDGLVDPAGYLHRLTERLPVGTWVVVEKILEPGERLPAGWPCAGTTGYDALAVVDRVLVDGAAEAALTDLDAELTGRRVDWAELVHDCKLDVATGMELAELRRLVALAPEVAGAEEAIAELQACFAVYRSYLPDSGADQLAAAVAAATARRPDLRESLETLATVLGDGVDAFARRFQQQTGAVMAKGVEDTAYFRYTRFIAANEVGADPAHIAVDPAAFHADLTERAAATPAAMTTLSTHDTKRSEDVRARLAVLSEVPDEWARRLREWTATAPLADGSIAQLLWQTLVGAWPIERDRLHGALEKGAREARTATSWSDPDERFEATMHAVIDRVYDDPELGRSVGEFVAMITPYGWSNSLAAKVIQLTMPGVPDVYQGTELWDNSLVDPDNRRPVDFDRRSDLLADLDAGTLPPVDATGAVKLLVVAAALRARRDRPELFTGYAPLAATGTAARHLVAFDRGGAITLATRLPATLQRASGWADTSLDLPSGRWRDVIGGQDWRAGPVPVGDLIRRYPVALLLRDGDAPSSVDAPRSSA